MIYSSFLNDATYVSESSPVTTQVPMGEYWEISLHAGTLEIASTNAFLAGRTTFIVASLSPQSDPVKVGVNALIGADTRNYEATVEAGMFVRYSGSMMIAKYRISP